MAEKPDIREYSNEHVKNKSDVLVNVPDVIEDTDTIQLEEELLRIKSMPVPMAQKRNMKGDLGHRLERPLSQGWTSKKIDFKKSWKSFTATIRRMQRGVILLNNSLRTIELRSGTTVANVFLFIKWTILLNMAMSTALIIFIIGPYCVYTAIHGKQRLPPRDPNTCSKTDEGDALQLSDPATLERFLACCEARYEQEIYDVTNLGSRGTMNFLMRSIGLDNFELWPISYSYYYDPEIGFESSKEGYSFEVAYVITGCIIFLGCLIILSKSIAAGVWEIINLGEGEFYKYSNLVFAGWEHCTNDEKGAEFKRRVLRNELKIALQTEKKKITDLLITRRQKAKILISRVFVNLVVIGLILLAGSIIFETTIELTNEGKTDTTAGDVIKGFVPSFTISFFNLVFPIVLGKLGKLEKYSREWETALLLLRALFIRLFSVYAAATVLYKYTYCSTKSGYCTKCKEEIIRGSVVTSDRVLCWESLFADQIYRLILTDILIKVVLTFIVDPLRRLVGHCFHNKLAKRISTLSFSIVRHSLDVIYIQIITWVSFHFAPFSPIIAVVYCILIFYIKKFSVLYNCKIAPDTFRTTRSTGMFMVAKIISFVVVLFTYAFIVGFMVPSAECGPFRGKPSAWDAVSRHLAKDYPIAYPVFSSFSTPGIALPVALMLTLLIYYYYSVAVANRAMVETLRHLLILEGHDKQYLFGKLNSLRRNKKMKNKKANKQQQRSSRPSFGQINNPLYQKRMSLKSTLYSTL